MNLLANPSLEVNLDGWQAYAGGATISRSSEQAYEGDWSCKVVLAAGPDSWAGVIILDQPAGFAGRTLAFAPWIYRTEAVEDLNVTILDMVSGHWDFTVRALPKQVGWVRVKVKRQMRPNASQMQLLVQRASENAVTFYVDAASLAWAYEPTFDEAEIYKSRTIQTQVRAAIGLDYPVFSGDFNEQFSGASLNTNLWFANQPSWGVITVGGGVLNLSTSIPAISGPWIQSRHNLAFPLRRDTDWTFTTRVRFPVVTGFGVFMRICGRSFRDAEAIWALKCNTAEGLDLHAPDGFFSDTVIWSTAGSGASWRRYRLDYDASLQQYTAYIDQDDDGAYESVVTFAVNGRYADAIVIGNSTAVQGNLGGWTEIEVDYTRVQGTAEAVVNPNWAAPFTYEGTRFSYLPTLIGGRTSCDLDNQVDAAEITLANFSLAEDASPYPQTYTDVRFLNRRGLIEARAGDGNGKWTSWQILFNGLFAEKQVRLDENGRCSVTVPLRDRYRSVADDMEIMGAYSDFGTPIPGVGMNMTVAEIVEDIYENKCGLPATAYNVVATPWNTPRNYNIFGQSAQASVRRICEQTVLAVYQDKDTGQIQVQEFDWGSDDPLHFLSTAEEITFVEWTESAFEVTSGEARSFENTNLGGVEFTATWPPHREPYYGRRETEAVVVTQGGSNHSERPITALAWWARNRRLGSIRVSTRGQLWAAVGQEIGIKDDRFLGLSRADSWIVDGVEHSWGEGGENLQTELRCIYPHPDRWLRENLPA